MSNSITEYFKNHPEARKILSEKHKGKRYSPRTEFKKGENMGSSNPKARAINQYDLKGNYIRSWVCMADAGRFYNIDARNISGCCCGLKKTAYGYIWKYKDIL